MSTIKERIKELRKEKDLTQEELAKLLGLSAKSNIANYENGANAPSDEIKIKMCELFDCTMDYLMGRSDYKNENDFFNKNIDKTRNFIEFNTSEEMKILDFNRIEEMADMLENKPRDKFEILLKAFLEQYPDNVKGKIRDYITYSYEYANNFKKEESNVFPLADTPISVPVLGKISAGLPVLATENIEGYEFAPSSYIKEGFDYFYLRVNRRFDVFKVQ